MHFWEIIYLNFSIVFGKHTSIIPHSWRPQTGTTAVEENLKTLQPNPNLYSCRIGGDLQCGRPGFNPWVGKIPWRRERLPTPVFWPGDFHGLYSPWNGKESDMTEWLSLSLQCFTGFQEYLPATKYSLPHSLRSFISLCHTLHSQLSEIQTTKADTVSRAITT